MPTQEKISPITEIAVRQYLEAHPNFFVKHPDLLERIASPRQDLGSNVADFQHFAIRRLQEKITDVRGRYDELISSARDNSSTQQQVHRAILGLIKARSLEDLLEAITVDLSALFAVDVVRLAVESESAEIYGPNFPEEHYSGIVFIPEGVVEALIGANNEIILYEDASPLLACGLGEIFPDCAWLAQSVALLSINLRETKRSALLAFGVREMGRFHSGQGVELLQFLAQVIEERLDNFLQLDDYNL